MKRPTPTRQVVAIGVAGFIALAGLNIWAYSEWADQYDAAANSATALAECRATADQIALLRERPVLAGAREMGSSEITPRIEKAALAAGLSATDLVRISPEPARRLGESPYREQSTEVVVEGVSLRQSVELLHAITNGQPGLRVKEIRLSAPQAADTRDRWTLEATLAALIYSPQESKSVGPVSAEH